MTSHTYPITIIYRLDNSKLTVALTADVEVHEPETYYSIKNIRPKAEYSRSVLPDIVIKKVDGRWIHRDSERESHFSIQVGEAIDAHQPAPDAGPVISSDSQSATS